MSLAEKKTFNDRRKAVLTAPEVDWSLTHKRDRVLDGPITECVGDGDRILDLGCGQGDLLLWIKSKKNVTEQGIEIDGSAVTEAISQGLTVIQGDLEQGLADLGDHTFDIVILNQVISVIRDPAALLIEALRVGRKAAVTFTNFAFYKTRFQLALTGRLPVNPTLPYQWHNTPNIRLVTVQDFRELCLDLGFKFNREIYMSFRSDGQPYNVRSWPNMRASSALFVIGK